MTRKWIKKKDLHTTVIEICVPTVFISREVNLSSLDKRDFNMKRQTD